jgi:hypothetical protein
LKRLALFWLVCAAAGFGAAACLAVLLSLTVDGDAALRRSATDTAATVLEMRPMPHNSLGSPIPRDVGHERLIAW